MGGIGIPELLTILVIIMIVFGAGKIPDIGSAFGKSIKNFKLSMNDKADDKVQVDEVLSDPEVHDADPVKQVSEFSEFSPPDNSKSEVPTSSDNADKG